MKLAALVYLACLTLAGTEPTSIGFDTLAGFEWSEGMKLPTEVTKLDQKTVTVPGFMKTEDGSDGDVDCFMLVNQACNCSGTPKMNEIVYCYMPDGKTAKIQPGSVKVTGKLSVGEQKEEGVVVSIYVMDVDSID